MDEKKLKGLCRNCMYRKRCEDAKRYLNMIACSSYRIHGNRKKLTKRSVIMNTVYDFETAISELMDKALNKLSSNEFEVLKDRVSVILTEYD